MIMPNRLRNFASLALLLTSGLCLGGCGQENLIAQDAYSKPQWTPNDDRYVYEYYPSQEVYFDAQRRLYFWHASAYWGVGQRLPSTYRLEKGERMFVALDSNKPYRRHNKVLASIANPGSQQARSLIVSVNPDQD